MYITNNSIYGRWTKCTVTEKIYKASLKYSLIFLHQLYMLSTVIVANSSMIVNTLSQLRDSKVRNLVSLSTHFPNSEIQR